MTVCGVIPREEITGDPNLGHDLIEVAVGGRGADEARGAERGGGGELSEEEDDLDTVLVPYVPEIVVAVRPEEGLLLLDPPDGLFELIQPKQPRRVVIRGLLPQFAQSLERAREAADVAAADQSAREQL